MIGLRDSLFICDKLE